MDIELASALTEEEFNVAGASDYFEALWKMNEIKPDLVLMNVDLPLLDGWEACRWIHNIFGIPIILLGEEKNEKKWEKAVQAGADFYLETPFSYTELVARVRAILRRYEKS